MKRVLIAGASGMVGGIVCHEALNSEKVREVVSLARRPTDTAHVKLKEVIHSDFADLEAVGEYFENIDAAYFCIGAYTGNVPNNVFKVITVDQAVAFGDMLKTKSPQAKLAFLSGQGADRKEKSRMAFARYKGMAENHLISLGLGGLSIFRPGYIYPVEKRKEPNLAYRISRSLIPLFKWLPHVTSVSLGKAMFKAGIEGTSKVTLENKDIIAL